MGIFFKKKSGSGYDEDTFVIVGLGNPGSEYEKTRHNMGFRAIDVLAADAGIDIRRAKFHALTGQGRIAGYKVILVKPQTYMNRSGIAVREAAMYYNVPSCNVIVIYDDIDLPLTAIRVRKSGGAGTHNGMKSVVQQLGVKDFPRIRIGVGAASGGEDLVDRVIGKVPKVEQAQLDKAAEAAALAAEDIIRDGIEKAMSKHNYSPEDEEKKARKAAEKAARRAEYEARKAAEKEARKAEAEAKAVAEEAGAEAKAAAQEAGAAEAEAQAAAQNAAGTSAEAAVQNAAGDTANAMPAEGQVNTEGSDTEL